MKANDRVRQNFHALNNDIPPIYGLRKDHKPGDNPPPLRPVCGAVTSCNSRISYFLAQFLTPILQDAETTCESSEDLIAKLNECNEKIDMADCCIGISLSNFKLY